MYTFLDLHNNVGIDASFKSTFNDMCNLFIVQYTYTLSRFSKQVCFDNMQIKINLYPVKKKKNNKNE